MSSNKVTKYDLVDSIFKKTHCEKSVILEVVDNFLSELKESLSSGSKIELRGFGTFEPRLRKGREKARNPKTGEIVTMASHYVAAFRAGKELKQDLYDLEVKDE